MIRAVLVSWGASKRIADRDTHNRAPHALNNCFVCGSSLEASSLETAGTSHTSVRRCVYHYQMMQAGTRVSVRQRLSSWTPFKSGTQSNRKWTESLHISPHPTQCRARGERMGELAPLTGALEEGPGLEAPPGLQSQPKVKPRNHHASANKPGCIIGIHIQKKACSRALIMCQVTTCGLRRNYIRVLPITRPEFQHPPTAQIGTWMRVMQHPPGQVEHGRARWIPQSEP